MDFTPACSPHRAAVARYCTRLMQSPEDGEDVTQTVMTKAWSAWGRQTLDEGHVLPWLYRIARNACVDAMRRRKPWTLDLSICLDAAATDVEREAIDRAECARVVAALGTLHPNQHRALLMSLAGYGDTEAARLRGTTKSVISKSILRGRRQLRKVLAA